MVSRETPKVWGVRSGRSAETKPRDLEAEVLKARLKDGDTVLGTLGVTERKVQDRKRQKDPCCPLSVVCHQPPISMFFPMALLISEARHPASIIESNDGL